MSPTAWILGLVVSVAVAVVGARLRPRPARDPVGVPARPHRWPRRRTDRRPSDLDVADWCERVAAAVRAGHSLTAAVVDAAAPTPFPRIALAVRRGRSLMDALAEEEADPATASGLVAPVLMACAGLGGPAARSLEQVAVVLHARAAEHAERATSSAQARLSARVLTTVPFGVVALLAGTEPTVRAVLVSPAGAACVGLGGVLNLTGWWWMRTIIAEAV